MNEEELHLQLDLVDEVRTAAEQRLVRYQNLMAKHYNSNVRHRDFYSELGIKNHYSSPVHPQANG